MVDSCMLKWQSQVEEAARASAMCTGGVKRRCPNLALPRACPVALGKSLITLWP